MASFPLFLKEYRFAPTHKKLFSGTLLHFIELIGAARLPQGEPAHLFVFPMATLSQTFSSQLKRPVCAWTKKKKGRKISTSLNLRQNKNKQTQEKGAAQEVHSSSEPQILLMWLKAACQPNLIWIYIQRKCLV